MLLVLLGHCVIFWSGNWFTKNPASLEKPLELMAEWLNSFHVQGFVLVSGYLYGYAKYEKGRYEKYGPFLMKKAKRLLVPFVFVALAWTIPAGFFFGTLAWDRLPDNILSGLVYQQLWFLPTLFWVFLLFYPLSDFLKKRNVPGALLMLVLYGLGMAGRVFLPDPLQFFRACMFLPVFWVGFKLRRWDTRILYKVPVVLWLILQIALFALSQYMSQLSGTVFALLQAALELAVHLFGAVMAFAVLQKIAGWWGKKGKLYALFSKNAMPVYLLHQQIIYMCIYYLNGLLNPYLHAAVNLVIALPASLMLAVLLQKWKVTRFLIGEG